VNLKSGKNALYALSKAVEAVFGQVVAKFEKALTATYSQPIQLGNVL